MAVKYTIQGLFIYAAMLGCLGACAAYLFRARKAADALFGASFAAALAGFVYRWIDVRHVPLQNLFEVFLCLGALAFPICVLSRRLLRVGGEAGDALIGALVLFPAGFVFGAEPQMLPPALQSPLFAPHVMAYMLAYIVLAKAGVQAARGLGGGSAETAAAAEADAYRVVRMGFPLLTLGLVLGAWWGKMAWGDYWNWDPKEMWSLVTWLLYVCYLHFRHVYGTRFPRAGSLVVVGGAAAIVVTLLWVNLAARFAAGLHSYAR